MKIVKGLFNRSALKEVFTPNTIAKLTYVKRNVIEEDLRKYISMPGTQIVVYGHSGGGKTTLVRNILTEDKINFIRTHCESNSTFNDILLQGFDALNRFYVQERTTNASYSISSELKAEYKIISGQLTESISVSTSEKSVRLLPPLLTPQKLSQFLGEINSVWLIEDFHKMSAPEKKRIADVVKIFIDQANDYSAVKIICIGAVGTARELLELDDNLNHRVAELAVPLLNDEEIYEIISKGTRLLNISMAPTLVEKIIYYSNNLGSLAHQICFDICYHSGIKKTGFLKKRLNDDNLKKAVDSHVRKNSDTFANVYDLITSEQGGSSILRAFDDAEQEYLSLSEIKKFSKERGLDDESLRSLLERMGTSEFKELIRYNPNSKRYSITTPFFRAFLKMKLALEKSESRDRNKRQRRKRENRFNIDEQDDNLIFTDKFIEDYYQYLDTYLIKTRRYRAANNKHRDK